jgi:uncharacterized protein (TIGR02285 family)
MGRGALVGLVLLGCCQQPVLAEPLPWVLFAMPGAVNLRDGKPYDGLVYEYLRMIEPHLEEVQVSYELGNLMRMQKNMDEGRNLCSSANLRSPERDRIGYFIPYLITPPMQVVVRAETYGRLPLRDGRLWVDELLAADLRGGFFLQRSYPPALQARLSARPPSNLIAVSIAASTDRTLRMLSHQRFDYTFEYPSTVVNYARSNPESVPLRSVTLADAADLQVVGSYCTRNAWGRAMALRIDAAVRARLSQPEPVLALYRHWLPVESYQAYGAGIEAYLRQRAEQPLSLPAP